MQLGPPSSRRTLAELEPENHNHNTTTPTMRPGRTRHPWCLIGQAAVSPNSILSVRGPRVRRRSATSPAVVSRSASARARTGETKEEPPRTEVERHRPAAAPCRGPAVAPRYKKGALYFKYLLRPSSNHSARRCLVLLFRPPQNVAPSASGGDAPPQTCCGA